MPDRKRRPNSRRVRLAPDPPRRPEVVGVGVGHDDRVHIAHPEAGRSQPSLERLPGVRTGKPRIHDGEVPVVEAMIPTLIDPAGFSTDKDDDARFTIGMIGYGSRVKDPTFALRVIDLVRAQEPRVRGLRLMLGREREKFPRVRPARLAGREDPALAGRRGEDRVVLLDRAHQLLVLVEDLLALQGGQLAQLHAADRRVDVGHARVEAHHLVLVVKQNQNLDEVRWAVKCVALTQDLAGGAIRFIGVAYRGDRVPVLVGNRPQSPPVFKGFNRCQGWRL